MLLTHRWAAAHLGMDPGFPTGVRRTAGTSQQTETRRSERKMDETRSDVSEIYGEPVLATEQDALRWLRQVEGTVYHNRNDADGDNAWVAVVRTPPANGKTGKLILAFGESVQEAAGAAEEEWNSLWSSMSATH